MQETLMARHERALGAGITRALVNTLKHGQRAQMLPMAKDLWPAACQLQDSTAAQNNALSRYRYIDSCQELSTPRGCVCQMPTSELRQPMLGQGAVRETWQKL